MEAILMRTSRSKCVECIFDQFRFVYCLMKEGEGDWREKSSRRVTKPRVRFSFRVLEESETEISNNEERIRVMHQRSPFFPPLSSLPLAENRDCGSLQVLANAPDSSTLVLRRKKHVVEGRGNHFRNNFRSLSSSPLTQ
ncbi:hypothetical protein NE237_028000 [Protea cynaroides]|uniref:Uncharacterized protein n=1 Tax=Protea cynaroides TaxID=273540 RepID=A0A9Q0JUW3_9MAGN|nr:hypothetical protein NE237_028000 [Protea cynaroides]